MNQNDIIIGIGLCIWLSLFAVVLALDGMGLRKVIDYVLIVVFNLMGFLWMLKTVYYFKQK